MPHTRPFVIDWTDVIDDVIVLVHCLIALNHIVRMSTLFAITFITYFRAVMIKDQCCLVAIVINFQL